MGYPFGNCGFFYRTSTFEYGHNLMLANDTECPPFSTSQLRLHLRQRKDYLLLSG